MSSREERESIEMDEYIKFYGWNDFATYSEAEKVRSCIKDILEDKTDDKVGVVKILEWVNVQKFIKGENNVFEISRTDIDVVLKIFQKKIPIFFNELPQSNLEDILREIPNIYLDDFLANFSIYKLANKFPEQIIFDVFTEELVPTYELLKHKYFSESYPNFMKDRILSNSKVIETLLMQVLERSRIEFFTPKSISKNEWEDLLIKYISEEDANLNFVRLLQNSITVPKFHFQVTSEVKVLAKRKCREIEEKFWENEVNTSQSIPIIVCNNRKEYEESLKNIASPAYIGLVDKDKILKNSNMEDLFNYLAFEMGLFSKHNILTLPRYKNIELGVFERYMEASTPKTYKIGSIFELKEHFSLAMLNIFRSIIENELDTSLEEIVCWYFNHHIRTKFKTVFLPIDFLSKTESVANRNAKIFSIEENIRKQYLILTEKGTISKDIFNETLIQKIISLPSKIKTKYIYLNNTEDNIWMEHQLFSDQSEIIYIDNEKKGKTFDDLLLKNDLTIEDFHDYQKPIVKRLIDINIIREEKSGGILKFKNIWEISVLKKVYYNTVFSYYYANTNEHNSIDSLLSRKILKAESQLFSVPEAEYMNFIMNTGDWDDGYGLRNNYQHGGVYYDNNGAYGREYLLGMLILITYMVKIDEELDLQNSLII